MDVFELAEDHWIRQAHKKSIRHRPEVEKSKVCGCFHCLHIFSPDKIEQWTDGPETENETALCPSCGIDSVIGDASDYAITPDFLTTMKKAWFECEDD